MSLSERPEQLLIDQVPAWASLGACWARSRTQLLRRGEDYFLQIDSHMRFVQDWDQRLIGMLAKCPSEKPVLSTYPLEFTPPDTYAKEGINILIPKGFDSLGILTNSVRNVPVDMATAIPMPSYLIGAGLIFSFGRMVDEVPYDPYIYFQGEEISMAVRLWTNGWDIFTPNEVIAYHDYGVRPDRIRNWKDPIAKDGLDLPSRRRVCYLLGIEVQRPTDNMEEIEEYGVGSVRTISEFETTSGIDFNAHMYNGMPLPLKSLSADFPSQLTQRHEIFSRIWMGNSWRNGETRSGPGSTLNRTVELRVKLLQLFKSHGIRILADAGCGDLNWMKEITGQLQFYFGYDIVTEMIAELHTVYADRNNCFFVCSDIVMSNLPSCDAILCRDCLTHLPLDAGLMTIDRFRRSGSRYLIATTHLVGHNRWVNCGGWFQIDLNAPPFNLPRPDLFIVDDGPKLLGVWSIEKL